MLGDVTGDAICRFVTGPVRHRAGLSGRQGLRPALPSVGPRLVAGVSPCWFHCTVVTGASQVANTGRGGRPRASWMPTTRQAGMAAVAVLVAYTVLKVAWPDHRAVEVLDALIFPALG